VADIDTIDAIRKLIKKRVDNTKDSLIYNVDDDKQLMYHRGQIKSLEDLQQDINELLKKTEL
jgi:hypothetical protein|tara:strand:+ start:227 stop:412 length:186 start_codon:yes stop_codon:yes gene_type:complete